jgi:hypothetical protein
MKKQKEEANGYLVVFFSCIVFDIAPLADCYFSLDKNVREM